MYNEVNRSQLWVETFNSHYDICSENTINLAQINTANVETYSTEYTQPISFPLLMGYLTI